MCPAQRPRARWLLLGYFTDDDLSDWESLRVQLNLPEADISLIAGMTHQLAGHAAEASSWADRAREQDPQITQDRFFRSFPFARDDLRATVSRALSELGI